MDTATERYALIVDDDHVLRSILARFFQRRGFRPLEAEDNAAAMQQLQAHRPAIITTDMYRPGGSGIALIKQIRAQPDFQQVPILFLSGSATDEVRLEAKQAGAFADMGKPFYPAELEACIAMVVTFGSQNSV